MTTLASLSKFKSMIEQINDNVFRVHRSDLSHRPAEIFEQIQAIVKDHHSCLIARKREDANINGSAKLIEDIPNDYRSYCFVIVHRNKAYPVEYNNHVFEVIFDRYGRVESVFEPLHGIEMLTVPRVADAVLEAYKEMYGNPPD